jgi:hypothetical protein
MDMEELAKCNRMEFKFIDGYGVGHFLVASSVYPGNCGVSLKLLNDETFTVLGTFPVIVDEVLTINHVNDTGEKIYLYRVREEKSFLYEQTFSRNYNVIDKNSVSGTDCKIVGGDYKNLKEIIELETSMTVNFDTVLKPFNVMLEGMDLGVAIDYLCSAYGLVWTVFNNQIYIYEGTNSGYDPTSVSEVVGNTPTQALKDFTLRIEKLDCCLTEPTRYATFNTGLSDSSSTSEGTCFGKELATYFPFHIAIPSDDPEEEYRNIEALNSLYEYLFYNFQDLIRTESTVAIHNLTLSPALIARPKSLSIIYYDNGEVAKTIYRSDKYPALRLPKQSILDRVATDLVGELAASYAGPVDGFLVTPIFGFNGAIPESDIFVYNLLDWDYGQVGAMVFAKWDCINERWVAYQQKYTCPPEGAEWTITPSPPPSDLPINLNELVVT